MITNLEHPGLFGVAFARNRLPSFTTLAAGLRRRRQSQCTAGPSAPRRPRDRRHAVQSAIRPLPPPMAAADRRCGPVGFKKALSRFSPAQSWCATRLLAGTSSTVTGRKSVGRVRSFLRQLRHVGPRVQRIREMGKEGPRRGDQTWQFLTRNATFAPSLGKTIAVAFPGLCMHEVVLDRSRLWRETNQERPSR